MFSTIARITALLAIAIAVIGYRMGQVGIKLIPIELPLAGEDVTAAAQMQADKIRSSISLDWFFIAAYGSMFLGYALLHWLQQQKGATALAITTALLAIGTVAFDVLENRAILAMVDKSEVSRRLFAVSAMKWLLFFLVVAWCGPLFVRTSRWWVAAIGIAFIAAGLAGTLVSASLAFRPISRNLIEPAMKLSLLPLFAAMLVLLIRPSVLLADS